MRRRSHLGTPALVLRPAWADPVASALLAVLVGIAVLVVALVPRLLATLAEEELDQEVTSISPVRVDVSAIGLLKAKKTPPAGTSEEDFINSIGIALPRMATTVGPPLSDALGSPEWIARFDPLDVYAPSPVATTETLTLGYGPGWQDRVSFIAGRAPAQGDGSEGSPIQIALAEDSAEQLHLSVGATADSLIGPVRVSGVFRIDDPADPYWAHLPAFTKATGTQGPTGLSAITASAYLNPLEPTVRGGDAGPARIEVWYPVIPRLLHFSDLPVVAEQARQLVATGAWLDTGEELGFQAGLVGAATRVVERVTAMTALLSLAGSAPLGVVLAVLALGARTVIDRRSEGLVLAAARGASSAQLRLALLLEGCLVALPAGAIGLGLAVFAAPARVGPEALVLPVLIALTVPLLFAVVGSPRGLRSTRADLGRRSLSGARLVIEVLVVGLAALALGLLGRRGLTESSQSVGLDPLLAATPLLLSLAVCVVVLRLYPVPVLALHRRMRSRRGAVGLIGSARAVRDPTAGPASVLAIVAGVAAAVFSLVMATTVAGGLASAAREAVGADIRVETITLTPGLITELAAVPGVAHVAGLGIDPDVALSAGRSVVHANLVFVDGAALAAVRPDIAPPGTELRKGSIPYLASSAIVARIPDGTTTIDGVPAVQVGTLPEGGIPGVADSAIIVDRSLQPLLPDSPGAAASQLLIAVAPSAQVGTVAHAVTTLTEPSGNAPGDVEITDTDTALAAALARPSTAALAATLVTASALSLALTLLAIIVGTIAATGTRNRILGVLRMLGMSPRQARGLVAWELLPVAATSLLAGAALGIALPRVVAGVLDLRTFVGGALPVTTAVPVPLVIAVVAGFGLVIAVAGAIGVAVARRVSPAQTVKMGAE